MGPVPNELLLLKADVSVLPLSPSMRSHRRRC